MVRISSISTVVTLLLFLVSSVQKSIFFNNFLSRFVITIAAATDADNEQRGEGKDNTFGFSSTETLAAITEIDFDWEGSVWRSRDNAIAAGTFRPHNNIITGINHYKAKTFLTVPRWKSGVPSTLNTLEFLPPPWLGDQTPVPTLRPWPDWETNRNVFKYVQSVFVDHEVGEMWVIDTGRINFFDEDERTKINSPAALYILNIENKTIVKHFTFPQSIFSKEDSFLNDIVVDTVRQVAYMTDTNIAGRGAIVAYRRADNSVIRFEDPNSTHVNRSFVVEVDGVEYPSMVSPADGIALSGDAARLFYSAVTGNTVYSLNTSFLRKALDAASSFNSSSLFDRVEHAFFRNTASDGLVWLPTAGYGSVAYGTFTTPTGVGAFTDSGFTQPSRRRGGGEGEEDGVTDENHTKSSLLSDFMASSSYSSSVPASSFRIDNTIPWVDTFAVVPWYTVDDMCNNVAPALCPKVSGGADSHAGGEGGEPFGDEVSPSQQRVGASPSKENSFPKKTIPTSIDNCDVEDMFPVEEELNTRREGAFGSWPVDFGGSSQGGNNLHYVLDGSDGFGNVSTSETEEGTTTATVTTTATPTSTPTETISTTTTEASTTTGATTAPPSTTATTTTTLTTTTTTTSAPTPPKMVCPNLFSGLGHRHRGSSSNNASNSTTNTQLLYGFTVYYTANKLHLFFNGSMNFNNRSNPNMLIYRKSYTFIPPPPKSQRSPTEMKMAIGFLGAVGFLSFVTIVILIVAKVSRDREELASWRGGGGAGGYHDPYYGGGGGANSNYRKFSQAEHAR